MQLERDDFNDFNDFDEYIKEKGIYISEILQKLNELLENFITYINAIESNTSTLAKLGMIRKAESTSDDMIQVIISNINPDLNRLIELDQKENDSYRSLTICIGLVQNEIKKYKGELINKLSNKERLGSNKITNEATLDPYSSYLTKLVKSLVFSPIKEAFSDFCTINRMNEPITNSIKTFEGSLVSIKKDKGLFWYLVFSYLFRSSQIVGFMSEQGLNMPKRYEIKDLRRFIRMELESRKIKVEIEEQKKENKIEEKPQEKKEQETEETTEEQNADYPTDTDELEEEEEDV